VQRNPYVICLIAGGIGAAILPWYGLPDALWPFGWVDRLGEPAAAPALIQAAVHGRWWLWPIFIALAAPLVVIGRAPPLTVATVSIVAGGAGLAWFFVQGFAVGLGGWNWEWTEALFGPVAPQPGMGYGALVTGSALLLLTTVGIAGRGTMRGDVFVVSSIGVVIVSIAIFVFFPVIMILVRAAAGADGGPSIAALVSRLTAPAIWSTGCVTGVSRCGVFWNSLVLAVTVGVLTTLLGLAFALLATRTNFPAKRALRVLAVLPVITPPFVIGLGMILLFGRNGVATVFLADWLGIPQTRWIYGYGGLVIVQVLAFTPIAFLVLVGMIQGISASMEEAAQTLRADRWRTFSTVTWPLLRPGLANAFLIGFVESLADFGNPLILAGNFNVLATDIYFAVVGSHLDPGRAAALAIVLLGLTLSAFTAQRLWLGKRSYTTVGGKGDSGIPAVLPGRVRWAVYAVTVPWLVFTVVLYGLILFGGFVESLGINNAPTLRHYRTAFGVELTDFGILWAGRAWPSFFTTVQLAAIAAPLTAAIGLLTAYLLNRQRFAGQTAFEFITLLSFAIPGTVIGVSYIIAFNVPPIELTGTAAILVLCFVFRNMPVSIRAGVAAMSQIDKSLDECSLTLRHTSAGTIRRVILPLLRPAIVTALVYSFVSSITAVSAIIFLVSARHNLATAYIVGRVEVSDFGLAIAYSSVLIVFMMAVVAMIQFTVGRTWQKTRTPGLPVLRESLP
jgi:iron(III) transport system permease protein